MPSCQYKYCRSEKFCKVHPCKETGEEVCFKPYPPRMTAEEFEKKQKDILGDIPDEFKSALSYMAYERGHSAGYEEVIIHLQDLVSNLQEPIDEFRERLLAKYNIL